MLTNTASRHLLALTASLCLPPLMACANHPEGAAMGFAQPAEAACAGGSSDDAFFANGNSRQGLLASILAFAGEPSLACGREFDEAYRLIWIERFEPRTQVIRLTRRGDQMFASVVVVDGRQAGWFRLVSKRAQPLNKGQWHDAVSPLTALQIWFRPVKDARLPGEPPPALDSWSSSIEARSGGQYYCVIRNLPREGAPFLDAGRAFFVAAGLEVPVDLSRSGS